MKTLLVLMLLFAADADSKPRKPGSIAPSLPDLTLEEENKLDAIIDRFILADTGRLRGAAARKAVQEFEALKTEAIPALIRGLNKAAKINHSCPALVISRKLNRMLLSSTDQKLLDYARDEIGADVGKTRYASLLQDLRVRILLRRNALARLTPAKPVVKSLAQMSTLDLARAASTVRGEKLKVIVTELGKRNGKEALAGLTVAANSYEKDIQTLARKSMDASLGRLTPAVLSRYFEDDSVEVRRGALRAAAKHAQLVPKIIDRVEDPSAEVRAEARAVLKALSKGEDFGPEPGASTSERSDAKKKWLAWWQQSRK